MTDGDLLHHLPTPLLEEFVAGRWLPIVGAGLSRNADTDAGAGLPDWEQLGAELGRDLPEQYGRGEALEVISAYEHRYGRTAMTTRIARALQLGKARPGQVHEAFAALSFENVVTTNVEQLLEDAYRQVRGSVFTVIEDGQLRMSNPYEAPMLVKLHGDLHNPSSLVLTEEDYERVPHTRPLMLTWLASQLIQKTGVLIGYSLDDWDVRTILAGLRDRLGTVPPDLWVLTVGANPVIAERYRRRGVRVAELPQTSDGWGILHPLFLELGERWRRESQEQLSGTTSVVDAALRAGRPVDSLVLFLVEPDRLRLYSDYVFPKVARAGLLPVSRADVRAPTNLRLAAVDGLLRVAGLVVVETDDDSDPQFAQAVKAVGEDRVLRLTDTPRGGSSRSVFPRPLDLDLDEWEEVGLELAAELSRRRTTANSADTTAGVQSAGEDLRTKTLVTVIDLEAALRAALPDSGRGQGLTESSTLTLRAMLQQAVGEQLVPAYEGDVAEVADVRNALVHSQGDSVDEAVLVRVGRWCRAAVQHLQEQQRTERPSHDFFSMLEYFHQANPGAPHSDVATALQGLGYVPAVPEGHYYIRWHFSGAGGAVTLYQNKKGVVLDSRVHHTVGRDLPGARVQGRRVLFYYPHVDVGQIMAAADTLRRRVVAVEVPPA